MTRTSDKLAVICAAALSMTVCISGAAQTGGGVTARLARPGRASAVNEKALPANISVQDAVDFGLSANPSAVAAKAGADSALANYRSLASLPSPQLGVSHASGSSTAPTLTGSSSDTAIDVGETIDTSGQRRYQAAGARAQYLSAKYTYDETRLTLEQQIRDAYWALAAARALTSYNHESLLEAEKVNKLVQAQQAVGQSPRMDVVRSGIDVANAQQAYITAQGSERSALSALNTLLGRAPELPIGLAVKLEDSGAPKITAPVTPIPDTEALIKNALTARPAVRSAAQLVAVAEYSVKQSRASRMPDLSVDYQRSLQQSLDSLIFSIHVPLVDLGTTHYAVRSAEAANLQAAAQLKSTQQQVAQQVSEAAEDLKQARQLLAGYVADILSPSITLREMAQAGYREGATGILPVIDAESTLRSARTGYVNSLLAVRKAEDALNAAVGTTVVR